MPRRELLSKQQVLFNDLVFDWSYQAIDRDTLERFAKKRLPENFDALKQEILSGTYQNASEGRSVTHVIARSSQSVLNSSKFTSLVTDIRAGRKFGVSGKAITDVVNVGVGGSDLGPYMASYALKEFNEKAEHSVTTHFVSSMDGAQLYDILPNIHPETTLFIVASKSFGTIDTFANVETIQRWVMECFTSLGKSERDWFANHVVGVSANPEKMTKLGIPEANQLQFEESIGGRFSMWSAIGLPIAISCGLGVFERLLAGAKAMDEHFANAPLTENIPMLMALCGLYNREERGINNIAVLPYDGRFLHLPAYLQQLDMESNGKQCTAAGEAIHYPTGPLIWGGLGPNGQHAFYQHLHQGFDQFAADFVLVYKRNAPGFSAAVQESFAYQQRLSVANCLAHRKLMAYGSEDGTARNYYPGEHPSSLFALEELTPESFGAIIAAYEHKVFTQGVVWQLNSFDQPGVELGKKVAEETLAALADQPDVRAALKMGSD